MCWEIVSLAHFILRREGLPFSYLEFLYIWGMGRKYKVGLSTCCQELVRNVYSATLELSWDFCTAVFEFGNGASLVVITPNTILIRNSYAHICLRRQKKSRIFFLSQDFLSTVSTTTFQGRDFAEECVLKKKYIEILFYL